MGPYGRAAAMQQVGERIRKLRKQKGMTQDQLAEQISDGCSGKTISKYENGMTDMRMLTFFEICEALECSADDLAPSDIACTEKMVHDFHLLNQKNKEMIETIIQALLIKQIQEGQ